MNLAQKFLIGGIRVYQCTLSPVLAGVFGPAARCRFEPSCSRYAAEAVRVHGAVKGAALAVRRVCRCQPWGGCGDDPVPGKTKDLKPNISESGAHTCGKAQGWASGGRA